MAGWQPAVSNIGRAWSCWPAPAKLNLFLHVTGRRPDGYHLLQTVFQLLDWGDEVRLRPRADARITRLRGADGVAPEDDLVVRAARALRESAGLPGLGVDIDVVKRIPQGGGFGGGSSDAASVLVGLNRIWRLNLPGEELERVGLALGADVPVFVRGRSAFAEGVGEALTPLVLPACWYLLVDSGISVPTAELFRAPDLTRDSAAVTIADFVSGSVHGNAFEPVLRARSALIASVMDQLAVVGSVQVTGTGGGLFVPFDDLGAAQRARQRLPATWRAWIAKGVDISPLHRSGSTWADDPIPG